MSKVPQLIIYIIDKDSKAKEDSSNRKDLNAKADVVGICLNIPSLPGKNYRAKIAIRIDGDNMFGAGDLED